MKRVADIAPLDRPRERLLARGAGTLTDQELLAVLLNTGSGGEGVLDLAARVLAVIDAKNGTMTVQDLLALKGIGETKACALAAALEFSRRRIAPEGIRIRGPEDVLPIVQHLVDRKQETVVCISLNGAHEVIATRVVTVGLVNACQVHPREVFAEPLMDRACAVLLAHNHPSGELTPSDQDRQVTDRLREAAAILGITFLDHVIVSKRGLFSIAQNQVIERR